MRPISGLVNLPLCVFGSYKNGGPGCSVKKVAHLIRCTICGPLGLLFMYLFRWRKGQGGALYVWEHIVIPNYRTAWRMFMKLGRDEELMAPHMHQGVSARSTQGQIQGRAKIGHRGLLLPETSSSDRKATATNGMYNNDLEACGMKCHYFLFHSEVKFFMHSSFSGERQWPFGPLVYGTFSRKLFKYPSNVVFYV